MMKTLVAPVLALALATPAAAKGMGGMDVMQYYVGTWSCMAGPVGQAPTKATATYTIDNGVMRLWVLVPVQAKMTRPYGLSIVTTYDAKNGRYVQTSLDNDASWGVAFAKPWTGNTERWVDHAVADGKLGHSETVRTSKNAFSFASYPTLTSTKAGFRGGCTRTS
jgi:hypothetical protein